MREDLSTKLEKALEGVRVKSEQCDSLQSDIEALKKQLADTVKDLETQLQGQLGDADHKLQSLNIALAQEKARNNELSASLQEAEENVKRLEKLLGDKNVAMVARDQDIEKLSEELDKAKAELRAERDG